MQPLPPGYRALGQWQRWIICRVVPSQARPGKTDKLPLDPRTHEVVDPLDPQYWCTYEEAAAALEAAGPDHQLGFVFTSDTGLFVVDLDDCLTLDRQWSAVASEYMTRLTGCGIEMSQSGNGLHIIGRYTSIPEHGCRNKAHGTELYHEGRFICLTLDLLAGDCDTDATGPLAQLVADHFPPTALNDADWHEGPMAEWNGPADDDVLLRSMERSTSASAAFGGGCRAWDLFANNEPVLAANYPTQNQHDPYDRSSADHALATHLNFWTGNDHPRVERLMRRSRLVREKWDSNKHYLKRTIVRATSTNVMQSQRNMEPVAQQAPAEGEEGANFTEQFMHAHQLPAYFAECTYVSDVNRILMPNGRLIKPESFKAEMGGFTFALTTIGDKTTDDAFKAFTLNQAVQFPKAQSTCFMPELKPRKIITREGISRVNIYVQIKTPTVKGYAPLFDELLRRGFASDLDRHILMTVLASYVQNPGKKAQWAPILQGAEGCGKTLIFRILAECIGLRWCHFPNLEDLTNKFNGWMEGKLLVGLDDILPTHRYILAEIMKPLMTNDMVEVQGKGQDQRMTDNRMNFVGTTNHIDAIPITENSRRWAAFKMVQQTKEDVLRDYEPDFFVNFVRFLKHEKGYAIINHTLRNMIVDPAYDPLGGCILAPETSTSATAIEENRGAVEQDILDAIEQETQGFRGGWCSSSAVDALLRHNRNWERMSKTKRKSVIESLGFIWHPALKDGRASTIVMAEGCRPKLYIQRGHIHGNLTDPSSVMHYYQAAQGYPDTITRGGSNEQGVP